MLGLLALALLGWIADAVYKAEKEGNKLLKYMWLFNLGVLLGVILYIKFCL